MHYLAILNRDGGTLRTMDLEEFCQDSRRIFEDNGHEFSCRIVPGKEIVEALEEAASSSEVDALIAGGGDGTVSTAAAIAFKNQMPLAVLPAGTMNLFARSLKLPLDHYEALEAIAEGDLDAVDIATANDRTFVHQFSVGIHARLVRVRETFPYRSRIGKIMASFRAISSAVIEPPEFEVELKTPEGTQSRRTVGLSVSNNPFGTGHIPHADELHAGVLGVYVASTMGTRELIRLGVDVMRGTWNGNPMVSEARVSQVVLRFPKRKKNAYAVIDGELVALEREVEVQLHPKALKVIVPRVAQRVETA